MPADFKSDQNQGGIQRAVPIYRAIEEQIMARIDSGDWSAGKALPAEVALAQDFRVSVGTIRRALAELTAKGILARRRKTGTVVTGRAPLHNLRFYYSYFRLHARSGARQNSTAEVLRLERRPASATEAERLALPADSTVISIFRVRHVGTRPVMHECVILPEARVPDFPAAAGEVPGLLYSMLWERYGIKIAAIREQIEAELATEEDCRLLKLEAPAAILVLREVAYDEQARPILINDHRATTRDDIYINEIQ